jgi:hypothetical protein
MAGDRLAERFVYQLLNGDVFKKGSSETVD